METIKNPVIVWSIDDFNTLGLLRELGQSGLDLVFLIKGKAGYASKSKYCVNYVETETIQAGYEYLMATYKSADFKPVLVVASDEIITFVDQHRKEMEPLFILPGTKEQGNIEKYIDKNTMTALAEEIGILCPQSKEVRWDSSIEGVKYPCLIKPSHQTEGHYNEFKFKICQNEKELKQTLRFVRHESVFILQQYIKKEKDLLVYVEDNYFEALKELSEQADTCEANLVLMGIEPTYPSEKYGYIIPESADHVATVKTFKEKPTVDVAEQYIAHGALWNGGVFAYKLGYVMNKAHELMDFTDYQDLFDKYDTLKKISFDYAVVEHEPKIQVVRFAGMWKDLGTWNTLTEAMDESIIGKGELNDKCSDVHIINEMDVPVLAMGLHDVVISASPEGILVSDKEQSSYIKPFVDKFEQQIMFAEKSWGSFKVVDVETTSLTIKVTLNPGHSMNYHSHKNRDEVWVVISGEGKTIVDGMEQKVKAGDVITMSAGCRHTVMADTELKLIEVQLGEDINVHDKQKFELEY